MPAAYQLPTAASAGFRNATAYDAHRPSYPASAVDSLLLRLRISGVAGAKVVEIASGTGKFTELLVARAEGFAVAAVEPHAGMREQLERKALRGVQVLDGHAGSVPVADGWGDACVAAQAFHWFATEETLREVHRVLKPGAVFGVIWNIEDYNKPASWSATTKWEQKLNDWVFSIAADGLPRFRDEKWQDVFTRQVPRDPVTAIKDSLTGDLPQFSLPLGEDRVPWTVWLSDEALWARINTLSQVAVLEGEQKREGERVFREALTGEDVERNDKGEVALHGVTFLAWTDRV